MRTETIGIDPHSRPYITDRRSLNSYNGLTTDKLRV